MREFGNFHFQDDAVSLIEGAMLNIGVTVVSLAAGMLFSNGRNFEHRNFSGSRYWNDYVSPENRRLRAFKEVRSER